MKVKSIEDVHSTLQPIADGMEIEIVEVEFKQGRMVENAAKTMNRKNRLPQIRPPPM